MWATSIALSDAYHHILMRDTAQCILCFQIGKIPSSSLQLNVRSVGIHRSGETIEEMGMAAEDYSVPIHRRLAKFGQPETVSSGFYTGPVMSVLTPGFVGEYGEIRARTVSDDCFPRGKTRFGSSDGFYSTDSCPTYTAADFSRGSPQGTSILASRISVGPSRSDLPHSTAGQVISTSFSDSCHQGQISS